MRVAPFWQVISSRRKYWQWVSLAMITIPFIVRGAAVSKPAHLGSGDLASWTVFDGDAYRLAYEAHQLYGRGTEGLSEVQLARVKRSFRCSKAMDKFAEHGLDNLSDDECKAIVEVLPKHFPRLDESPAFARMLEACRRRLDGASETMSAAF
jgi:hypothetical protein